ncbi:RNA splicing protein MRS2, mitochondrial precursor [Plasmodium gonderi]|uniref:Magnesium transporter n=1 Tax=Plasmodium gonderi TaxID=77519 RepID=A0A1Y1JEL0_PLAGO|nr:RNA splicing protein MRS2, mitochondrial precursor [Plasmodium gonderi]GAW80971.1 RNA splicing protein MRS2, mitochondrial precursor [Plasmodium gonderi]
MFQCNHITNYRCRLAYVYTRRPNGYVFIRWLTNLTSQKCENNIFSKKNFNNVFMQNIKTTQDGQIKCERLFFSKYSLPYVLNIPVSDLRLIDPSNNHNPTLLVRKNMILLRTGFMSCVIRFNELWLFEPSNPLVKKATNLIKKNFRKKGDFTNDEIVEDDIVNTVLQVDKKEKIASAQIASAQTASARVASTQDDMTIFGERKDCSRRDRGDIPGNDDINHMNVKNSFYKYKASMCFEFLCLDICMQLSIKEYELELYNLNGEIKEIILQQRKEENNEINMLTNKLLRDMMKIKNNLQKFSNLLNSLRTSIEKILKNRLDMENMYLTFINTDLTKSSGLENPLKECTDLEILLETHLQLTDELYGELENVEEKITHYEELMRLNLDYNRNKFILLNAKISFATLFFSISSVITSLFGMNLKNFAENNDYAFLLVSFFVFFSSLFGLNLTKNINTILKFFDKYNLK